ncbi:BatA domain-containing protein [Tundrisphaera sp. TA3]|uniref:BatA domain-containing protein n=1 Tax=Tundrisphaera sp. TA3 TaxID=3435775 RepID=UPI003EC14B1B
MSFLQPMLLLGLPLVALPIIIHLVNQRRYQTVRWAAMMFLLAANRMSRGYARIRQWLILGMRMAAIAGLAFAISRPLAGGWLGLAAGGRVDATILVLDRSPSMQQAGQGSGATKLEAGRRQLVETLRMLGPSRWILIDGARPPRELETVDSLLSAPDAGPSDAPADLPAMLQAARDYLGANKAGQADVWICSDLRANDWDADGGRWQAVRESFRDVAQRVRFHLLAYPQTAPDNLSVRVSGIRRQDVGDAAELLVSVRVVRDGVGEGRGPVPVQFEIDGVRSQVSVEMSGREGELKDHRIVLEKGRGRGWGKVSIPADANPADDAFWFAFDRPRPRRAVVVADDADAAAPLRLAASIAPDPSLECSAEVVSAADLASVEWEAIALLIWQAPLPEGEAATAVRAFIERGGRAIFLPPRTTTPAEFLGVRWAGWVEGGQDVPVDGWRSDQDLLSKTDAGAPLPVGQLGIKRYARLEGETTVLATLKGGAPLLARAATARGGAYFCATTAAPADSTLAGNGVVLYVLIQRAMAEGAAVLEDTRLLAAGSPSGEDPRQWKRLAGAEGAISTDLAAQAGVYASGDRLLAVNRPIAEDAAPVVAADRVASLFQGLDFSRVDDTADNAGSLIQEVWRLFLVAMMGALVVEAALCLPKKPIAGSREARP